MHVAINANLLHVGQGYRSAGISRYLAAMLHGLQESAGTARFTVFTARQPRPSAFATFPNLRLVESDLAAGSHSDSLGRFSRTWVVTNDVPSSGTKRVDLSVTWEDAQGTQEATMTTHIMR